MRKRAADAAASLSAAQADHDTTSSLASRLLANMEAASKRRREALEMRKARSAAKHDLLLQRLVSYLNRTHLLYLPATSLGLLLTPLNLL
jgi:hypothetical protein